MKKIAILSLHLGYGGIEKCIVNLANILSYQYDVELAVSYNIYGESVFPLNPSVKVKYLNNTLVPNHSSLKKAFHEKKIISIFRECLFTMKVLYYRKKTMIEYIKKTDADVVISTRDIFNYWLGKYGSKDIFKIGWEHNHFHGNYHYLRKIKRSVQKLNYLVLVSKELQKIYKKELKNSSCHSIYIPNFLEEIPSNKSSLEEKNFISVGRLSKEKGYSDLLILFKEVKKIHPDWRLHIVGDGPEKEVLKKYIEENKLEQNVKLHGFQKKEYIDSLFDSSSLYLMTSYTESFGIVLIEAMSHGIPCLAYTTAEGAKEIIEDGENGYLIPNRDSSLMLEKIDYLITHPKVRKIMGNKAKESILPYTKDVVKEKWYNLIEGMDIDA